MAGSGVGQRASTFNIHEYPVANRCELDHPDSSWVTAESRPAASWTSVWPASAMSRAPRPTRSSLVPSCPTSLPRCRLAQKQVAHWRCSVAKPPTWRPTRPRTVHCRTTNERESTCPRPCSLIIAISTQSVSGQSRVASCPFAGGARRQVTGPVSCRRRRLPSVAGATQRRFSKFVAETTSSTCGFAEFSSRCRTAFPQLRGES